MSEDNLPKVSAIDHFLRSSQSAAAQATSLQKLHAEKVATLASSPEGWHGPDDIQTLIGLGGHYLWAENPLQVARISFRFDAGHVGSQGTYEISSALSVLEEGMFTCVPNNPAIGWAAINLMPGSMPGAPVRGFIVAGMWTESNWKIMILLLSKLGNSGPIAPPFSAVRIS